MFQSTLINSTLYPHQRTSTYRHKEPQTWNGLRGCASVISHLRCSEAQSFGDVSWGYSMGSEGKAEQTGCCHSTWAASSLSSSNSCDPWGASFILFGNQAPLLKRDLNASGLYIFFIWLKKIRKTREVNSHSCTVSEIITSQIYVIGVSISSPIWWLRKGHRVRKA